MCGIVGYIGAADAAPVVMHGLRQLEYRGYDSAGLAVIDRSGCIRLNHFGQVDDLFVGAVLGQLIAQPVGTMTGV